MAAEKDFDSLSGAKTTGHEWDGIRELNTPLPRWWVWLFYATIVWAFGYWLVYPAWPTLSGYTAGWLGYSSRTEVGFELAKLAEMRGERAQLLQNASLADIEKDPALLALARAQGRAVFGNNCAPCHGTGAAGSKGYPNLNDDDWLWGGTLEQIQQTIQFGIRSGNPKARESIMPAFGKDGILTRNEILAVADYVRASAGLPARAGADLSAGRKVFVEKCGFCHGENGKGNQAIGAPDLTDRIWLYGSDEATIVDVITNGRGGIMPAWVDRLDPVTIKALAVYVHSLGGGK
jgi:cytochrome c oxidase cbb3-type subunit 3